MPRKPKRAVHGILLLDKPLGMSSNRALQGARIAFDAAKAGHTGSLDPLATGLLPICFGEATKIAGLLLGSHKCYEAECRLGEITQSDDAESEVIERRPLPEIDDEVIRAVLARFVGRIDQVPPKFSAIKRDGVRMYELARRGEAVDLEARSVDIHAIELVHHEGTCLRFRVECGSGTYIRSLARDIGEVLGCGAHLVALRRLWVDPFHTPRMVTPEALEAAVGQGGFAALDACLLPIDAGLADWPALYLDAAGTMALTHGQDVAAPDLAPGRCRAYADDGRLLALAEVDAAGIARSIRRFNLPPMDA